MNLLQQFLSASQDFRDLMARQDKQDEKLKEIEGKIQGGGGGASGIRVLRQSIAVRIYCNSDSSKNSFATSQVIGDNIGIINDNLAYGLFIDANEDIVNHDSFVIKVYSNTSDNQELNSGVSLLGGGGLRYGTIGGNAGLMFCTGNVPVTINKGDSFIALPLPENDNVQIYYLIEIEKL